MTKYRVTEYDSGEVHDWKDTFDSESEAFEAVQTEAEGYAAMCEVNTGYRPSSRLETVTWPEDVPFVAGGNAYWNEFADIVWCIYPDDD